MISKLKKFLSILCIGFLCGYSAWKGMEWVTISSMLMFIALVYFDRTKNLFEIGESKLRDTQQFKFRDLELQVNDRYKNLSDISRDPSSYSGWIELLMTQLDAQQMGLVLQIQKVGRLRQRDGISFPAIIKTLRHLRGLGLIYHNHDSMAGSTEVWLTEMGEEFAKAVYLDLTSSTSLEYCTLPDDVEITTSE